MRTLRNGIAVRTFAALMLWSGVFALAQDERSTFGLPSALVVDPVDPAVIYAGFFDFGLFKTVDGGAVWSRLGGVPGDRIAGLAIDPFVTTVVYVLEAGHGLFKSEDGGLAWRPTGAGLAAAPGEIRGIVVDPDDPLTLYAPTARGLFRSFDGAESFERLDAAPPAPAQVLFHPHDAVLIYLVAGDALAFSDDFGETWQQLGRIGAATRHVAIDPFRPDVFYAATEDGVLASADGGRAWGPSGLGAPAWRLAFDAAGAVLAVTDLGLLRLDRLGEPWLLLSPFAARRIAVHPFDPRIVFLADRDGEVVSSDQGGADVVTSLRAAVPPPASLGRQEPAWKAHRRRLEPRLASPPHPANPVAAIVVDPDDPAVVYAASHRGVYRSYNYGELWEPASSGLELLDVHALAIDPEVTSTLYAGTHGAGLFRSFDRGKTWSPARRGLDVAAVTAVAVDPLEPSVLYAGGRGGLYTSRDQAATWKGLDGGAAGDVRALAYPRANPLELVAGTARGRVLAWAVTVDEGRPTTGFIRLVRGGRPPPSSDAESHDESSGGLAIRDLAAHPDEASVLYAATILGLWRSADAGLHWEPAWQPDESPDDDASYNVTSYNVTSLALDPLDPSVLYAGSSEGLLRRSEGRWSRVKIPGVRRRAAVYSVAGAGAAIYAGLDDGRVAVTRDSGATWEANRLAEEPRTPDTRGTARAREAVEDHGLGKRLAAFYAETPAAAVRQRALLALELASRGSIQALEDLEKSLEEIRLLQLGRGDEATSELRFSADSRWLLAEHRFDDGEWSHSEMRLYDVDGLRLKRGMATVDVDLGELEAYRRKSLGGSRLPEVRDPWWVLADVDREPEHLHPGWVIADPGDFLAWSPGGRYLATRSDADRISVWRIVVPPRSPESRYEPRTPDDPPEQRLDLVAPGVRARAWSAGGRYLAVAGPRGIGREETVVYLADLDRTAAGTLDPWRTVFAETVTDLRFTPESRWLWIRATEAEGDPHWGHLVPRVGRWKLIFSARLGELFRVAPESRLHVPLPDAPEAFAELAASPDGRWLAGRPASADGAPAAEVRLWFLGALGPTEPPHVLPLEAGERGLRFSSDSRCLGLERSASRTWDLAGATAKTPPVRPQPGSGSLCRTHHWMLSGSGGVLEWPTPEPPAGPPRFVGADAVLDGWGTTAYEGSLVVWRGRPETGWEAVKLPAPYNRRFEMSPDRRWIVVARRGRKAEDSETFYASQVLRLWDLEPQQPATLEVRTGRFGALELHDDEGAREWVGREIVHWDPAPSSVRDRQPLLDGACRVLGRNLTLEEWRKYAGSEPYAPACEYELYDGARRRLAPRLELKASN